MKISRELSEMIVDCHTPAEVEEWLRLVEEEVGKLIWPSIGGKENNIHAIEAASSAGLALVERPTNCIDALLDLEYLRRQEEKESPSEAAEDWYGVKGGEISKISRKESFTLSKNIAVRLFESGEDERPTVQVQDTGMGQHPDDWEKTVLSLGESNKKAAMHLMGVYNSGGAASYRFSRYTIIFSRRNPDILDGRADEIGVSVVRYNDLDVRVNKTGTYQFCKGLDEQILRLDLKDNVLPFALPKGKNLGSGTVVRHISYELDKYSGPVGAPKKSLWALLNPSLPMPLLPIRIYGHRAKDLAARGREVEMRTIRGNMYRLGSQDVSEYSDSRIVDLGKNGKMDLHYHVVSHSKEAASYVDSSQALTVMYNGQRQIVKSRSWLRRQTSLNYLQKRLIVHLDANGLSHRAKRGIFSSTRESGVDSKLLKGIFEKVIEELLLDDGLIALNEKDRERALSNATASMSKKLKKALEKEVSLRIRGDLSGIKGGIKIPTKKRRRGGKPPLPDVDDGHLLEVPNQMAILSQPLKISPGSRRTLVVEVNAKNGFLPDSGELMLVFGDEIRSHVYQQSVGRLNGGKTRIVLQCDSDAPLITSSLGVSLVIPNLGVNLSASTMLQIEEPDPDRPTKSSGGEPNVSIKWASKTDMGWSSLNVGVCHISKSVEGVVEGVEWILNKDFQPWLDVETSREMTERKLVITRDRYQLPVAISMFRRELEEEKMMQEKEEQGLTYEIPDDYKVKEEARMAFAVLYAMSPEIEITEPDYDLDSEDELELTT